MIWSQSLEGRAIDLTDPQPEQVDFAEIAWTLAGVYRWAGAAACDVSVALHTLIVFDAAPDAAKPYALLHDAHEARIGDITRPVQQALERIAEEVRFGSGNLMRYAIGTIKYRHDAAIWAAAGLPAPSPAIRAAVHRADITAMMTERRDFLRVPPMPWRPEFEAVAPLARTYRWRPKPDVAATLYQRFEQYLPALKRGARP